jgi:hypothetical protein
MHEDGFGLVVGVMGDGHTITQAGKKVVAGFASGFFNGKMFGSGKGGHVDSVGDSGDAPRAGSLGHELGFAARLWPQAMIQMGYDEIQTIIRLKAS